MLGLSGHDFDDDVKVEQFVDNITADFGHMLEFVFFLNAQS